MIQISPEKHLPEPTLSKVGEKTKIKRSQQEEIFFEFSPPKIENSESN